MLIRSGITLLKYWFSVSDDEQERRFEERAGNPSRRWKLSPMDLKSMAKWEDYSRAKDEMLRFTDTKKSRWWTVEADDKRRARLNCIAHILSCVPYKDVTPPPLDLPKRPRRRPPYKRPPKSKQHFVPDLDLKRNTCRKGRRAASMMVRSKPVPRTRRSSGLPAEAR